MFELSAELPPRAVIAYWPALILATSRFGASRNASGRLAAPDRRMSSAVITNTDAGAWLNGSARLETDITVSLPRSSSEKSRKLSTAGSGGPPALPGGAFPATAGRAIVTLTIASSAALMKAP